MSRRWAGKVGTDWEEQSSSGSCTRRKARRCIRNGRKLKAATF